MLPFISLRTMKNNLNNSEAYSEPGQTSKMDYFAKIANG